MSTPASPAFFQNIQPVVKSPDFSESWADEVESLSEADLGSQRDRAERPTADDDDGFTVVGKKAGKNNNQRGSNNQQRKGPPSKPRGNSQPRRQGPPDAQHWHTSSRGRGRGGGGRGGKRPATQSTSNIIIDPRTVPEPPGDLSADAKLIYNIIRENQASGGCTCRKIDAILQDRGVARCSNGQAFDHLAVGDILYDELKKRNLVYKQGEIGGKWRILVP